MKNGFTVVLLTTLGTLLGGWLLVWLPAEAVLTGVRNLGEFHFRAWIMAPIQMPAWYFLVSLPLLVSMCIWAGISLIRYSRQIARPIRLSPDEALVLELIGVFGEHQNKPTAPDIAKDTGLVLMRIEHALEQLVEKEMIGYINVMMVGPKYYLKSNGRAYLLRRNTH